MITQHILVIEDDPNDEALTLKAIKSLGEQTAVYTAHSFEEAVNFFETWDSSSSLNAVLMDNTLPGFNGSDLIRIIRSQERFVETPLVVFSGSSDYRIVERCLAAGASAFVEKPIDMHEYLERVREIAKLWISNCE